MTEKGPGKIQEKKFLALMDWGNELLNWERKSYKLKTLGERYQQRNSNLTVDRDFYIKQGLNTEEEIQSFFAKKEQLDILTEEYNQLVEKDPDNKDARKNLYSKMSKLIGW